MVFDQCTEQERKILVTVSVLLIILVLTSLVCFLFKNMFEGYSTMYPLPYLTNKWGHVQASEVVYPGSTSMDKVKQLEEDDKHMNKTLFKSTWSKNYANTGIWPDSTAPPKYGSGFNRNAYVRDLKNKKPNYKTTCFTQSPLTVEKVLKPMPNQFPMSFN